MRSALARAEELSLASVGMRAISTGIFGYPARPACQAIVDEVVKHLLSPASGLRLVRLVSIDEGIASELRRALLAVC